MYEDTYEMTFICSNCGFTIVKTFDKGQPAYSHGECPNCMVNCDHKPTYPGYGKKQILLEGS